METAADVAADIYADQPESLIPSDAELAAELEASAPKRTLYRGGREWFRFEFNGKTYYMPPDLDGKMGAHPDFRENRRPLMCKADGLLVLEGQRGKYRDSKNKVTGHGPLLGASADDIVKHAMRRFVESGVVVLMGDERDQARKDASRTLYVKHRRAWAQAQVDTYAATRENFSKKSENSGKAPPRPSKNQRMAQEILDSMREEGGDFYLYTCEHGCPLETNEQEAWKRHMRNAHKATNEELEAKLGNQPEPVVAEPPAEANTDGAATSQNSGAAMRPAGRGKKSARRG